MNIGERIRQRMAELGLKQKDIIKRTGASPGTVSLWVNGISEPNGNYLVKLADCLHTSEKWLRTGLGEPNGTGTITEAENVIRAMDLNGMVPIISWVQAGTWSEAELQYLDENTEFIPAPVPHSINTYALRVTGESMRSPSGKSYPDGIIIIVDADKRSPAAGQRVIALLKDTNQVTFKQLATDGTRPYLMPLNPAYQPMFEEFDILGTVVGAYQPE